MLNRWKIEVASRMRFWSSPWAPKGGFPQVFPDDSGSHFQQKNEKSHTKRHAKINAEKVLKINAERLPKWCQNGYPNPWFFKLFQKRRNIWNQAPARTGAWFYRFWAPENAWQIDTKSMPGKGMKKIRKIMPKWIPNGGPNRSTNWKDEKKGIKNESRKNTWFLGKSGPRFSFPRISQNEYKSTR